MDRLPYTICSQADESNDIPDQEETEKKEQAEKKG